MSFHRAWLVVCCAVALFAVGCGGDGGSSSGGGGGSSQSFECCINGTYYSCPSETAVNACFNNNDPGGCSETRTDPSGSCN
jgi:hypothetical protein